MYPGPRTPFNGFGSRFMGPVQRPNGPGPGRHFFGPMRNTQYPMGPNMGMGMRMGQPAKRGGILAKLLGKGTQRGAGINHFVLGQGKVAKGGLLQTLTNPGAINGFLNNTQQVLKTAQSVGPMIQQYGPLVKNLPAMWKLYRGLKDLPDQEESVTESKTEESEGSTTKAALTEDSQPSPPKKKQTVSKPGNSRPKLFF